MDNNESQNRRPLTPEQARRRKLLREKRARERRRKLIIRMAAVLVLIVIIVVAIVLIVKGAKGNSAKEASPAVETAEETVLEETVDYTEPVVNSGPEKTIPSTLPEDGETSITLSFTGDVLLGIDKAADYSTSLPAKLEEVGGDYGYFFRNFKDLFAADDATLVDLEVAFTEATDYNDKAFDFKGSPDMVNVLLQGNVDGVTLANNHTFDYYQQGYDDTVNVCESNGIKTCGYDKILYLDLKGIKVAVIGMYLLDEVESEEELLRTNIASARENQADVIVVMAHWGIEKEYVPDPWQVQMGRLAIDLGADLVVGCHPHVLQGYEEYNHRYILYSQGNFCFGGNTHPYDTDCYVVQFTVKGSGNKVTFETPSIIPANVSSSYDHNDYQPRLLDGEEAQNVLNKIENSNAQIAEYYP